LGVDWKDNHYSVYPASYLRRYRQALVKDAETTLEPEILSTNSPVPTVAFEDLQDERLLYEAMKAINDLGVVTITGCPNNKAGSEELMRLFCEVPAYIPLYGYGSDYLCGAEKNETQKACPQCFCNIPKPIEMHQDFAYFDDVPGLFFNMCMRLDNGVIGGCNTAMDAFHVAEVLRKTDPESFEALSTIGVTFAKTALNSSRPVKASVDRPIIRLGPQGEIASIIWSLMYLRTQRLDPETLLRFAKAREAFKALIKKLGTEGYEVATPMGEGDCTILNNKRMMHGRLPFAQVDGIRQFYQSYGAWGLFMNRFKVLESRFEDVYYVHRGLSARPVRTL